jgi:hypothetical protein
VIDCNARKRVGSVEPVRIEVAAGEYRLALVNGSEAFNSPQEPSSAIGIIS